MSLEVVKHCHPTDAIVIKGRTFRLRSVYVRGYDEDDDVCEETRELFVGKVNDEELHGVSVHSVYARHEVEFNATLEGPKFTCR